MRDAQARLRLDALLVLIALVVAVVLCVVGWFLARELHSNQKVEDCVLSGRTNCVPIDTHSSSY
jgi:hypothetical protein